MTASGEPVGEPASPAISPEAATTVGGPPRVPARRGIRGWLRRIPHPPLRSTRGIFLAIVLVAGAGSAVTFASVIAFGYTETADFCARCHTMGPELKAHSLSAHQAVSCAECHQEPGMAGWIRAKINGTRQLAMILTGTFPKPIPAPDHADLPPTSTTCTKCHDTAQLVAAGGPVDLVLATHYRTDEANTRDAIALVLRPSGFGGTAGTTGVHWHIDSEVDYVTSDPRAQKIDWVGVTRKDGTVEEFLAGSQATSPTQVQPDIDRLKATGRQRRMDCIDCHNRVGHNIPSPDKAVDDSIAAGRIDPSLPYIKREASDRLAADYATTDDANRAIAQIANFYAARYPLVVKLQGPAINAAITEIQRIYSVVATPDMKVTASTYPNNLGHQSSPGCFRCHDGAHYKVVNGALSQETIPSACATCHTFPQIGASESGVLIGNRPDTHNDRLWVFNHKAVVSSVDPAKATCGACHTRTYCENCHNTPAVQVTHDNMIYDHAAVLRKVGAEACVYCHQPVYCAQCHANPVLPERFPEPLPAPSPATGPASSVSP